MDETNNNYPYIQKPNGEWNPSSDTLTNKPVPNFFARAAKILGIIALISVFTFTVYPAMILGALAIILAILSKGIEKGMHDNAKMGVITGIIALAVNVFIIGSSFYMIFTQPELRQQFNEMYESIYGESFNDTINGIKNGTLNYDDIY